MRFSRITPILILLAACDDNGVEPSDTNVDSLPPIINRPLPEFGTLTIGSDVRILPPDARPFPGIDTDGDGLYDAFELEQGLDPLNPDTDGDGIHDHWDLLGSEHALQTQTDDGFAWFDPSVTELLPPDIAASTVYNPPISGIHIQRTEPSHVVLFGISQYRPLHAPCIAPPNAPASCSARYTGNEMSNPTSVRLDVEASPYGQQLMWEMTTNVRIGSMSPDWIYEDDRVFQPQTAPILGVPARNWGPDPDGDGLNAFGEFFYGTDPLLWDTDGDGVPDRTEIWQRKNPLLADTDEDGILDMDEHLADTNASDGDPDYDTLLLAEEQRLGTNPDRADTDNDRLPDNLEALHNTDPLDYDSNDDGVRDGQWLLQAPLPLDLDPEWQSFSLVASPAEQYRFLNVVVADTPAGIRAFLYGIDYFGNNGSQLHNTQLECVAHNNILLCQDFNAHSNNSRVSQSIRIIRTATGFDVLDNSGIGNVAFAPDLCPTSGMAPNDADGDRLTDAEEAMLGTSPTCADTDGDGLTDFVESHHFTDPLVADTDQDGLSDFIEDIVIYGYPGATTNDADGDGILDGQDDADEDGLSNLEELALGTRIDRPDTDRDGLLDGDEVALGLSPFVVDTDGDGFADSVDSWPAPLALPAAGIYPFLAHQYAARSSVNVSVLEVFQPAHTEGFGYLFQVTNNGVTAFPLTEDSTPWPCEPVDSDWLCSANNPENVDLRLRFTASGLVLGQRYTQPVFDMRSRTTNVQAHSFPVPLFGGCPNPNSPYEDYDGVDRAAEQDAGTRRDCADTDGDGLPDGFELADWSPFDPLQADTSGNGTSDAEAFILAAESRQE